MKYEMNLYNRENKMEKKILILLGGFWMSNLFCQEPFRFDVLLQHEVLFLQRILIINSTALT